MRFREIQEGTRCWKGYEKKGMKTMFGKRVPNCVKREDVESESVGNTDAIGGALAQASGKVAGMTIDYVNRYFDYVKEKNAAKKKAKEAKLKQIASKMKPNEKANAKKIISKGEEKAKQLDLFDK
jgi:hypothetical protein